MDTLASLEVQNHSAKLLAHKGRIQILAVTPGGAEVYEYKTLQEACTAFAILAAEFIENL